MKYLILILLSFELTAQCKTEIDEFTKNITILSKRNKIGKYKVAWVGPAFLKSSIFSINGQIKLMLYPEYYDVQRIEKGETIYLKFTDGEVIELLTDDLLITGEMYTQGTASTIWYNSLHIGLTKDQLNTLRIKDLEKVRVHFSDYIIDSPKAIQEQIECVLNPKPPKSKK